MKETHDRHRAKRSTHARTVPVPALALAACVVKHPGLMFLFSTGIKREPNRFMVPRTIMIGGKVRSLGQIAPGP